MMRDKNKIYFLNVTFKVKRHPEYKGNHQLATFNSIGGCTFDLGTSEEEMTRRFLKDKIVTDIDGKTWIRGEIIQVVEIEKCFEDWCEKTRFHKDNYCVHDLLKK